MPLSELKEEKHTTEATRPGGKFVRDRVALFCYLLIATYNFCSASLGPIMAYLRAELHLDYTITAMHFSIWSLGCVLAGFAGEKCMRRFGKRNSAWLGCSFLCLGLVILIFAKHPAVSLIAAMMCGGCGTLMTQTLFAVIAERFGEQRAIPITEATIAASFVASLAPLVVGSVGASPLHWQSALIIPIFCFACYFLFARKNLELHRESESTMKTADGRHLPAKYWMHWAQIFLSVAAEWSIILWTADYLQSVCKLDKANAAASVTLYLAALMLGRLAGTRLSQRFEASVLLKGTSIVALLGFTVFWLNTAPPICLVALFITGLGIANFYPLNYALAIGAAPGQTSMATSRISVATGSSVLVTPFILGLVAQQLGIFSAYGIIAGLLVFCVLMVWLPVWGKSPVVCVSQS